MNKPLLLLVKFPTRERKGVFFPTLDKYLNLMDNKEDYTVMISCDVTDKTMCNEETLGEIRSRKNCNVAYGNNKSKIEAVNADLHYVTDWDILLLASDDMIPQVQGYDNIIRGLFEEHFPDLDGALHLNDGKTGDKLNTIVCIGKKYFDRFGYLYHPSYKSLWSDNESTEVGYALCKMKYIEQVLIKNESPDWGGVQKADNLYKKNNSLYHIDKANYDRRKSLGFPL